jgi:hypothetical protein
LVGALAVGVQADKPLSRSVLMPFKNCAALNGAGLWMSWSVSAKVGEVIA